MKTYTWDEVKKSKHLSLFRPVSDKGDSLGGEYDDVRMFCVCYNSLSFVLYLKFIKKKDKTTMGRIEPAAECWFNYKYIKENEELDINLVKLPFCAELSLDNKYTAVVTKEGVKVGCTTFSLEKVKELAKIVEEVEKDQCK